MKKEIAPYELFTLYFDVDHKQVKQLEGALTRAAYFFRKEPKDDWCRFFIDINPATAFLVIKIWEAYK